MDAFYQRLKWLNEDYHRLPKAMLENNQEELEDIFLEFNGWLNDMKKCLRRFTNHDIIYQLNEDDRQRRRDNMKKWRKKKKGDE